MGPIVGRTPAEHQTWLRIKLAVAAYAYEFMSFSVMLDAEYDRLSREVDPSISTSRPDMDKWFADNYDPSTGVWVHTHPQQDRLREIATEHHMAKQG